MFNQTRKKFPQLLHRTEERNVIKNLFRILIIGLTLILPSETFAQTDGVKNGDRVKILASAINEKPIKGTVVEISSSVLAIKTKNSTFFIPYSAVNRLAISKGRKRAVGRGALTGMGLGGLTGAASYSECTDEGFMSCMFRSSSRGNAFLRGVLIGGLLGGITGIFIKIDRWERLPVKVSMSASPLYKEDFSVNPTLSLRIPI